MYKIKLGKDLVLDESAIYEQLVKESCFKFKKDSCDNNFIFVLPPPNANGELHLGHSFGYTIMDCIGRFKRQSGFNVLLVPGKDHAGIQTQVVFEKYLKSKGINPAELSREEIYSKCYEFCMDRAQYMRAQEKSLGLGADWDYELFTLDPAVSEIVIDTFVKLYNDGLAYKADRIVNWSVESNTSISDIEVEYVEQKGILYYILYPWVERIQEATLNEPAENWTGDYEKLNNAVVINFDSEPPSKSIKINDLGEFVYFKSLDERRCIFLPKFDTGRGIIVATTRPETMLGDSAVAVNPDDPRYGSLIGMEVVVPETGRKVRIVAHKGVDPTYGTGALKVTPAHDFFDFEIGKELGLEVIQVIGKDGKITEKGGRYSGLTTLEARERILQSLKKQDLLITSSEITHKVPISERAKDIIEPLITEQWWLNLSEASEKALNLINSGELEVYPSEFKNLIIHWLRNLKDWNVSRQLWWGHRIPAWYKSGKLVSVSKMPVPECYQDSDTFDTWFSSGQWPYTTLAAKGLIEMDSNYDPSIYPTHMMVMGRDILFFWACRMILLGVYRTGKIPFRKLYFHGLILDEQGQKMSKSRGNGIEPGEIQQKYGTDVLRLSLLSGFSPGRDVRFTMAKCEAWAKFINKLINASKFVSANYTKSERLTNLNHPLNVVWYQSSFQKLEEYKKGLNSFEFSSVLDNIYLYFWDTFCDWIIEISKILLKTEYQSEQKLLLSKLIEHILFMFHPYAPFITEYLHSELLKFDGLLAKKRFDEVYDYNYHSHQDEAVFLNLKGIVKILRRLKIFLKEPIKFWIEPQVPYEIDIIQKLSGCQHVQDAISMDASLLVNNRKVLLSATQISQIKSEYQKAVEQAEIRISRLTDLLNSEFTTKAPSDLVERERKKLEDLIRERDELKAQLANLN